MGKKMTKKKKIIWIAVTLFLAIVIAFVDNFAVKDWINKNYTREEKYAKKKFSVIDTLQDGNGQTARVILLGGQSNAVGISSFDYLKQKVSEQQAIEYEQGFSNIYINYFNDNGNTTTSNGQFVSVKVGQGYSNAHFGPELGLAEYLSKNCSNDKFYIIKYAYSGTNLGKQWLSPSSDGVTGGLYTAFKKFVKASLDYLKDKNYNIKIEGMCWMQGESDSWTLHNVYENNTANFIKDIRKEFNRYYDTEKMLFVDAGIAAIDNLWTYHMSINSAKQKVATAHQNNIYIDTNAYGLTTEFEPFDKPDRAHYDSTSEILLGQLFAKAILGEQV